MIAKGAEVVLQFLSVLSVIFGCYDDVQMLGLSYFFGRQESTGAAKDMSPIITLKYSLYFFWKLYFLIT